MDNNLKDVITAFKMLTLFRALKVQKSPPQGTRKLPNLTVSHRGNCK